MFIEKRKMKTHLTHLKTSPLSVHLDDTTHKVGSRKQQKNDKGEEFNGQDK